jgi:hypothetical protein
MTASVRCPRCAGTAVRQMRAYDLILYRCECCRAWLGQAVA